MHRIEHNVATGEVIEISLTANEIKEIEKLQNEKIKKDEIAKAEAEAKAQAKAELLEQLGITEEQAKLLLS